jgi:hypothetical protein
MPAARSISARVSELEARIIGVFMAACSTGLWVEQWNQLIFLLVVLGVSGGINLWVSLGVGFFHVLWAKNTIFRLFYTHGMTIWPACGLNRLKCV